MDIAELRNKLNNIAAELAEQEVQQEDIAIEEDSYDHTSDDGHQIKDVMDYDDDYDGYSSELQTPLGNVYADWDSYGGRGGFSGIRADNKTLAAMINKNYDEIHDDDSMDKDDWPVAVGMAVDKVMAMGKDNPSFMRSESVKENSYNDYMADLKAREKAAGVSDDFLTRAGQDYDALMKAYADKINDKPSGKLDDPTTKLPQISPKKKMGKLDDPTTKLPQVAEEEVEETVEVPVAALAELMQLAGYENYADKLAEYENEPEEEYSDTEDQLIGLSGGLNGPKKMYPAAAGGDNPMDQEPREIEESMGIAEVENKLYRSYQAFLEENDMFRPAIKKYPPGTKIDPKTMLPMPSKDGPKVKAEPAPVPPGTKIDPKLGRIQVPKGGPKIKNLPFKVD